MIIALIALILFSGVLSAPHVDLSDPVVLVEFNQELSTIIEDPVRASAVSKAIYGLNVQSFKARSAKGTIDTEIQDFYQVAGNYHSTSSEVHEALRQLENSLTSVNRSTIEGREIIRSNTSKKEWKKLIKTLSKK
ncbi:MAG: hypothetical protein L3J39_03690 [Verrucomicrobiales bacterium]|nr:hypothetical protein [Verrucomicrobiales bacterium]